MAELTDLASGSRFPDPATCDQLRQLKGAYFRFVDTKQWTRLRTLFTDDCTFTGFSAAADNPDAFVDNLTRNLAAPLLSVHQGFTAEFQMVDAQHARAVWAMSDYLRWPAGQGNYLGVGLPDQTGIRGYGYYEDLCRQTEGGWKMCMSRLVRLTIDTVVNDGATTEYPTLPPTPDWL